MSGHGDERRERLLREYAEAPDAPQGDRLFRRLLAGNVITVLGLGALLLTVEVTPAARLALRDTRPVPFRVATDLVIPPAPKQTPAPERTPEPEVITPETRLDQAVEVPPPADATPAPPPRRVYGVRQVFAHGLGSGSGGDGALVVKRGNTLDGVADTLTATDEDLRGATTPLSTVEQAPVPVRQVKPRYSRALLENRVSGVVSARLLVDADGSVRRVEILDDIGFDSREIAGEALQQFRFRPARRGGQPVAVWILYRIRFEFQE